MTIRVLTNSTDGTARVVPSTALPVGEPLRLALFDVRGKRYLTSSGWVKTRKTLVEVIPTDGDEGFVIAAAAVALIPPGISLLLEEVSINLREQFTWPEPPPAAPAPVAPPPLAAVADSKAIAATVETVAAPASTVLEPQKPKRASPIWVALLAALLLGGAVGAGVAYALLPQAGASPELIAREKAIRTREADAATADTRLAMRRADIDAKTAAFDANLRKAQSGSQSNAMQLAAARSERDALQITLAATQKDLDAQGEQLKTLTNENNRLLAPASQSPQITPASAPIPEATPTADAAALNATIEGLRAQAQSGSLQLQNAQNAVTALTAQVEALTRDKKALSDNLSGRDNLVANWSIEREAHLAQIQALQTQIKTTEGQAEVARSSALAGTGRANWGAASVSSNGSVDTIVNQISPDSAERVAMKLCASRKGSCSLITNFQNTCFAVARAKSGGVNAGNWREGLNPSWQEAEAIAMDRCEQETGMACRVVINTCTPDQLSKPE